MLLIWDTAADATVPAAVFTAPEDDRIETARFRIMPSTADSITTTFLSTISAIDSTSVSMTELATGIFDVMEPRTEVSILTTALFTVPPQL